MARYSYAFQGFDATKHVRASIREKKISHKHARETAKAYLTKEFGASVE